MKNYSSGTITVTTRIAVLDLPELSQKQRAWFEKRLNGVFEDYRAKFTPHAICNSITVDRSNGSDYHFAASTNQIADQLGLRLDASSGEYLDPEEWEVKAALREKREAEAEQRRIDSIPF